MEEIQPGLPVKAHQGGFIHPRQQHNHAIYLPLQSLSKKNLPLQPPNKRDKQIEESKFDVAHLRKEARTHPTTTTRICMFYMSEMIGKNPR
jgi:hypothetical protein